MRVLLALISAFSMACLVKGSLASLLDDIPVPASSHYDSQVKQLAALFINTVFPLAVQLELVSDRCASFQLVYFSTVFYLTAWINRFDSTRSRIGLLQSIFWSICLLAGIYAAQQYSTFDFMIVSIFFFPSRYTVYLDLIVVHYLF